LQSKRTYYIDKAFAIRLLRNRLCINLAPGAHVTLRNTAGRRPNAMHYSCARAVFRQFSVFAGFHFPPHVQETNSRRKSQRLISVVTSERNGTEKSVPFRLTERNFCPLLKNCKNGTGTDIRSLDIKITERLAHSV